MKVEFVDCDFVIIDFVFFDGWVDGGNVVLCLFG